MKNIAMLNIQILGMGCSKCRNMEQNIKNIVITHNLEDEINIESVEDIDFFIKHGILSTPTLIINGEIVERNQELTYEELKQQILNALETLV